MLARIARIRRTLSNSSNEISMVDHFSPHLSQLRRRRILPSVRRRLSLTVLSASHFGQNLIWPSNPSDFRHHHAFQQNRSDRRRRRVLIYRPRIHAVARRAGRVGGGVARRGVRNWPPPSLVSPTAPAHRARH